ncbi:hypothetical protein BDP27DRAFT_1416176 [Rhodocollybia butyracea]|uniref:Uncharacterized protein n=1 Tax=Rhodocollybia butyracea TaxID=206335 RepID=A0A9P5UD32_9AGAR|nr:hypothetical protein BDP27DRAFT_1416176 [Rhodocollybia butyracea]
MHFPLSLCLIAIVVSAVFAAPPALSKRILRPSVTIHPTVDYEYHDPSDIGLKPVTDEKTVEAIHAATQELLQEAVPHLSIKGRVTMVPTYTKSPHEYENGFIEFLVHFELKTTMCGEQGYCVVKMSSDGQHGAVWASDKHGAGSEGKPIWQKGKVPKE